MGCCKNVSPRVCGDAHLEPETHMPATSFTKKIAVSLFTGAMLVSLPVMAQTGGSTGGGSAGDGDKPLNPANKTKSSPGVDATKDVNGNSTAATIEKPKSKHKKTHAKASSSASSM